jgi:hypothetical protein
MTYETMQKFPHFESHEPGVEEGPEEIFAIFFELSDKQIIYQRSVFSFMDLLRDLGGLRGALMWVITARCHAYSRVWFQNSFINNNFEFLKKNDDENVLDKKVDPKV